MLLKGLGLFCENDIFLETISQRLGSLLYDLVSGNQIRLICKNPLKQVFGFEGLFPQFNERVFFADEVNYSGHLSSENWDRALAFN